MIKRKRFLYKTEMITPKLLNIITRSLNVFHQVPTFQLINTILFPITGMKIWNTSMSWKENWNIT